MAFFVSQVDDKDTPDLPQMGTHSGTEITGVSQGQKEGPLLSYLPQRSNPLSKETTQRPCRTDPLVAKVETQSLEGLPTIRARMNVELVSQVALVITQLLAAAPRPPASETLGQN